MHDSFEHSVRADYRLLDRDWIDDRELYTEPNPARLRAACLMIYVGLLLSLGAVMSSFPAEAKSADYLVTQNRGVVVGGLEQETVHIDDVFRAVPICDQR